ncbi:LacI family DNA-binding transcriptional regulator, partial [Vibrio cholerae]|nr:LacI family DNA-binding transcriptional regulator [Vibrio cholerae]
MKDIARLAGVSTSTVS